MNIMASMMLIHSWLKFNDTPLFPMSAVTCLQTSNIEVFKRDESSSCAFLTWKPDDTDIFCMT